MLEYVNKFKKQILYIAIGLVVMYILIYLLTPKPQMPVNYKATIDSLTSVNNELTKKNLQLDSIVSSYKIKTAYLDSEIIRISKDKIIIRKYYYIKSKAASSYTPTQVDSFLKQRYNY